MQHPNENKESQYADSVGLEGVNPSPHFCYNRRNEMKTIEELKIEIEDFIRQYDGTAIGEDTKNRYENSNGTPESLMSIVEYMDNVR